MKKQHLIFNLSEIQKIARNLKECFVKKTSNGACIVGLEGNLGAGKTTLTQALAKELGIKEKILSPTFVIMKKFAIRNSQFQNFYHIDCYRINKPEEILSLGFKEIISESKNIIIIEWADKIKKILPKNTTWLKFSFFDEKTRKIEIKKWKIKNV